MRYNILINITGRVGLVEWKCLFCALIYDISGENRKK